MSSLLRPAAVFALVSLLLAASMPGCSQQGEGERCDLAKNGDADCDSGLVCVPAAQLRHGETDRCCKPNSGSSTSLCDEASPTGTAGSGGSTGTAGSSSNGGANDGGAPVDGMAGAVSSVGGTAGTGGSGTEAAGAPAEGGMTSTDAAAGKGGA